MVPEHPEISVIMAVYNGADHLAEAIDSILQQSFKNFEYVIVDDASTDATPEILDSCCNRDSRIVLLKNDYNIGLTRSLNIALQHARGRFIARMDADDISLPERLARQWSFMAAHPDVDVIGSWVRILRDQDSSEVWQPPSDHDRLLAELCFHSPLYHPTAFIRRDGSKALPVAYNPQCRVVQDYDLWSRLALDHGAQLANLPQVLLLRRVHGAAIGQRSAVQQQTVAAEVRRFHLGKLGIAPSEAEMALHNALAVGRFDADPAALGRCAAWLRRLRRANEMVGVYPRWAFNDKLEDLWFRACRAGAKAHGKAVWLRYFFAGVTAPRWRRLSWFLSWCRGKMARRQDA